MDEKTQNLLATVKKDEETDRTVANKDVIADLVESVHEGNKHGGLDATRKGISSLYYGICGRMLYAYLNDARPALYIPANVLRAPQP